MDPQQLDYLKHKQQQALQSCLDNTARWRRMRSELETVESKLTELPAKTRHEIMVPVGSKSGQDMHFAFMPGYIHHTNEIVVLLGDNWFVERSAKQAAEIAARRLAKCDKILRDLDKEKLQYEQWLEYVDKVKGESEDAIELVEKYDDEEEQKWRTEHRKRVRESKEREARERAKVATHDDLMDKLDLLELEEGGAVMPERTVPRASSSKSVRFSEEDEEFSGDTHQLSCPPASKSGARDGGDDLQEQQRQHQLRGSHLTAFTGEIHEKQPVADALPEMASTTSAPQSTAKRISKFKASRQ
ncbi:Unconventional prefoldin RPB5 interactor [Halotydeus destructor]|nr:Unconventional prefoldin RPB5 interactor [Halotydeus destructor]